MLHRRVKGEPQPEPVLSKHEVVIEAIAEEIVTPTVNVVIDAPAIVLDEKPKKDKK